jgi:quercetin dioxygenase-like cupin family protein
MPIALPFTVLLAAAVAAAGQPASAPGGPTMEVTRKAEQTSAEGPAEYFTGKVTISGQFQRPAPSRVGGAVVRFEPGARTAWHSHPLGQTLIVTEGVGWTQIEGGPVQEFQAGDVLWCPPEHKHWHGATPHAVMTHLAIQESLNGSPVTWMEKVTDAQYLERPIRGNSGNVPLPELPSGQARRG